MTKQIKIIIATTFFFMAAVADIWGIISANENLQTIAKPMLLTLLAVVYIISVKKPNLWYVLGMFFCFVGDVILMFNGANFFMAGIAAFLLGHVVYIKITASFLPKELKGELAGSLNHLIKENKNRYYNTDCRVSFLFI